MSLHVEAVLRIQVSKSHLYYKFVILIVFRASEAVKQMELSQKHEAEETAALEKMIQKVEANLETTTVIFLHCSH